MKTDMDYIAEQCAEIDRRQGVKPTSSCMVDSVVGLSDFAKQAVQWLFSDQAKGLSAAEARASILASFGESVDKELRSFSEPNANLTGKQKPGKEVTNV